MRFLLFHATIPCLNYFTNELDAQLRKCGHQTVLVDMCGDYQKYMVSQLNRGIDAVITYDCIGTAFKEIYDELGIPVINILIDHPMNLAYFLKNPTQQYIQFCADERHVEYTRRFFGIDNVYFMPHMASLGTEFHNIPYEKKDIQILFPGTLRSCNVLYEQVKEIWRSENSKRIALGVMERLLVNSWETLEDALEGVLRDCGTEMDDSAIAAFMACSKPIDVFVRMYWRVNVISQIVKEHIPLTLIGNGGGYSFLEKDNVTILSGRSYDETFLFMERAKITLNVLPWFKAGTHERIFNTLMHYSCPLTDESSWLLEHFKSDEECAYYSFEHLEALPDVIYKLLISPELQEKIICKGRDKVVKKYTSKQIVEQILEQLEKCYGKVTT